MLVVSCFFIFYKLLSRCRCCSRMGARLPAPFSLKEAAPAHTHTYRKQLHEKRMRSAARRLEGEQQQESHHKTEQTHSLRQGETQDGIGEQLLFQRWVSGITDDEGTEY